MSQVPGNGQYVQCPLCEGRGQLHRSEVLQRLTDKELTGKIASYLEKLQKVEETQAPQLVKTAATAAEMRQPGEFEKEVHTWPAKRFLWRRSPKE